MPIRRVLVEADFTDDKCASFCYWKRQRECTLFSEELGFNGERCESCLAGEVMENVRGDWTQVREEG